MRSTSTTARIGEVLADKYRVERVLGQGGMGVVVAARHLRLDEPVAMKMLWPERAADAETVDRFLREARAALRIKGEHVVRIMDVDVLESGAPYMVMELLEGHDLKAEIKRRGPLPVPEALDYVLQACEALSEAHALGIVHRDLKPENLFLAREKGSVCLKVLDFGISKLDVNDRLLTSTDSMLGTPVYMAPEQMRSTRDADARADIWSLGVILYQLLTARLPFEGDSTPSICLAVAQSEPVPIDTVRHDLPAPLGAIVSRCLHKERDCRYQAVHELALDLVPWAPAGAAERVQRMKAAAHPVGLGDAAGPGRGDESTLAVPEALTVPSGDGFTSARLHGVVAARPAMSSASVQGTSFQTSAAATSRTGLLVIVAMAGLALVVAVLALVGSLRDRGGSGPAAGGDSSATPASERSSSGHASADGAATGAGGSDGGPPPSGVSSAAVPGSSDAAAAQGSARSTGGRAGRSSTPRRPRPGKEDDIGF